MNVEMEPKMGEGENWTNGKVWKTELTENLCLQFSECRKVTTQKSFKCSHAVMLEWNLGWVMGKTEPTENLENWTHKKFTCPVFPVSMDISVGHYEKIEK